MDGQPLVPPEPGPATKSQIVLNLEGLDSVTTHRLRESIDALVAAGALMLRNGKAILNFDHEGVLQEIKFDYTRWRRKKE